MRFDLDSYEPVEARLEKFWGEHPEGRIETWVLTDPKELDEVVVRACVWFDVSEEHPRGSGHAFERRGGQGANQTSHLENCECVPLSSEILTRRGFLPPSHLETGEDVLAYDLETDACRWVPLERVSVFPSAPTIRLHSREWEMVCTPNHKWAVRRDLNRGFDRILRPADSLKSNDRIILSARAEGGTHPLTPAEAAILGWLFTDGCIRRKGNHVRGQIGQTKPQHLERIRELVGAVSRETVAPARIRTFPGGRTYETRPGFRWDIPAPVLRPLLEKAGIRDETGLVALMPSLTTEARAAMLEAMMQAEGDASGAFAQNPGPVLEAFMVLATLEGHALGRRYKASLGETVCQRVKKRRNLCVTELDTETLGEQPVWCPTTCYGTWVMRQGSRVTITGNTSAIGRALANAGYKARKDAPRPSREEMRKPAAAAAVESRGDDRETLIAAISRQFKELHPGERFREFACRVLKREVTGLSDVELADLRALDRHLRTEAAVVEVQARVSGEAA